MSKIMRMLGAAYTGQKLPEAHPQRTGWAGQLRAAAKAVDQELPEALLDERLYGPAPEVCPAGL